MQKVRILPNGERIVDTVASAGTLPTGHQVTAEQQAPPVGTSEAIRHVTAMQTAYANSVANRMPPAPPPLQGEFPDVPPELAVPLPLAHPGGNLPVVEASTAVHNTAPKPVEIPVQYQQQYYQQQQQPAPQQQYVPVAQPQPAYAQQQPAQYPPGYPAPTPPVAYTQQYQQPQQPVAPFPQQPPYQQPQQAYPAQAPYVQPAPPPGAPQPAAWAQPQVYQPPGGQPVVIQQQNPPGPTPPRTLAEWQIQNQTLPQIYPEVSEVMHGRVPGYVPLNGALPMKAGIPQPVQPQPPQQIQITHQYAPLPAKAFQVAQWFQASINEDVMEFKTNEIVTDPFIIEQLIKGGADKYLIPVEEAGSWVICPQCKHHFPGIQGQPQYQQQLGNGNGGRTAY